MLFHISKSETSIHYGWKDDDDDDDKSSLYSIVTGMSNLIKTHDNMRNQKLHRGHFPTDRPPGGAMVGVLDL